MKKKTMLLFYNYLSSFVKKDIEILSAEYNVVCFDFYVTKKIETPFQLVRQKLFLLRHILFADVLVCEFASYHSLLPALYGKVFRKPCFIIVGGTDTVSFPSIGYGNFHKKALAFFTRYTFKWCSHIVPKHKTLMWFDYNYQPNDFPHQGILYHCKNLEKPFTEIENGYDAVKWHCTKEKKTNTFITVCSGWEFPFQYQLKGIDLITEAATAFPDCEFIILGVPDEKLIPNKTPNIKILPPVKNEELINIYSGCEFYFQLSMAEGFPNALCEAMLCECIPIVSNVFSMPEIVGNSGFVLQQKNRSELKQLIAKAIASDKNTLRKNARQRIADNYTLEMRKQKLLRLFETATKKAD
ncbi:MAG: glycosyltransferase family 4 protein [Bacteroidetes bacterium]|nr:glycosyltransferase family 4 protein [Bacteroidota bacterium]